MEARLDTTLDLPRRNVSPPGPAALSDAMRARLQREAAAEFTLWDSLRG